jgi:heme/copper-type cytochrome/quinol oxidase subunit 2
MGELIMLGLIVYFIWYHHEAKKLAAREEEAKKTVKESTRLETWMTNFKGDDK